MDTVNRLKDFFLSVFMIFLRILPIAAALPPPPTQPEAIIENNPRQQLGVERQNLDWAMVMIGFCLPSAVEIALQPMQTQSQLPPAFHSLSLAIIFSFTLLFLGKFVTLKFPRMARVLELAGLLSAVTAIYLAITIPLPPWLKCITWTTFSILLVVIMVCIYI